MSQEQAAVAVIIALISEKYNSKKKRQKRKLDMKQWLKKTKNSGFYETLLAEMRLENEFDYKN